ncbi:pro-neuregulin-4, membrane-bound isoform-like isoform X1 [Branchiostoma floridae]|uniref:Pro-neuregulin-4, membrane-bound isoform n=2 Tax=Branchiostoma floridae TaxID=7739 RepID=A0A9J7MKR2_BRAFL|nr:pro-neuregulin-4, membrane-bound isoform-like isoform X1 [Branchiostoma floridae]
MFNTGSVHRLLSTCVALWIATSSVVLSQACLIVMPDGIASDVTSTVSTAVPTISAAVPTMSAAVPGEELQVNNMSTTEAHTTHRIPCPTGSPPLGYDGFCLHGGECLYLAAFQEASCRCLEMYWGQRCQYHIPFSQAGQKTELRDTYIIIGVLSALLTLLLVGGIVLLVRRCRRESDSAGPAHTHLEKGQSTDRLTQDV